MKKILKLRKSNRHIKPVRVSGYGKEFKEADSKYYLYKMENDHAYHFNEIVALNGIILKQNNDYILDTVHVEKEIWCIIYFEIGIGSEDYIDFLALPVEK